MNAFCASFHTSRRVNGPPHSLHFPWRPNDKHQLPIIVHSHSEGHSWNRASEPVRHRICKCLCLVQSHPAKSAHLFSAQSPFDLNEDVHFKDCSKKTLILLILHGFLVFIKRHTSMSYCNNAFVWDYFQMCSIIMNAYVMQIAQWYVF